MRKTEAEEDEELVSDALGAVQGTYLTQQPRNLQFGTLRDYQLEGLNWMINLHDSGISGILADEMGLGKTVQSIALLAFLRDARKLKGPHLVVVPKSTLGNWQLEFSRWCPDFSVLRLQGPKAERQRMVSENLMSGDFDVVLTTYEVVILERAALRKFSWCYIMVDEAHRIKNENSALSRELRVLESAHRLLITGTPLQNNLHELWALLNFLLPDVFSSSEDFDAWFCSADGKLAATVVSKMHKILRPFLLRRLKKDVERSLPPKTETKLYIGLSDLQREWYQRVLSKDAMSLNTLGGPGKVRLLNVLMQLRKVCNHPYLFDGAEPGPPYSDGPHLWEACGKMRVLHKLVAKLQEQGSRVLIFCQMTRMLDILEDYFRYTDVDYCRIDGNTAGVDRDEAMETFNAPGSSKFAFLLSTRAGGLGINLYTADVVILYDSDWNPQMDLQAMDRAHRIGQKKPVRVFRFLTEQTVEEKIVERAERKLYLDAAVIQQGRLAEQNRALSKDELMTMVTFGADEVFKSRRATVTDEEIDAILARGEERTRSEQARIQKDMQHNLSSFTLDSGGEQSIYLFDSKDYSKLSKLSAQGTLVDLGQRDRKTKTDSYDVDLYYRTAAGRRAAANKAPQAKLPSIGEFQFMNKARIIEIVAEENRVLSEKHAMQQRLRTMRVDDKKPAKVWIKARRAELMAQGLDKPDAAARAETEAADREPAKAAAALEAEMEALSVDAGLLDEKEALLREGYWFWSREDYRAFMCACERHGRANREAVVEDVVEATRKDAKSVKTYFDDFWHGGEDGGGRFREMGDWRRVLERVERGERDIVRRKEIEKSLAFKVGKHRDPMRVMPLKYASSRARAGAAAGQTFTPVEDRFLVYMMHRLGYGEWAAMQAEIARAPQFRFNWFIRSRSAADLQRRCDTLVRIVEAEVPWIAKAKKARSRRASDSSTDESESDDDEEAFEEVLANSKDGDGDDEEEDDDGEEEEDQSEEDELAERGRGRAGLGSSRDRGKEMDRALPGKRVAAAVRRRSKRAK